MTFDAIIVYGYWISVLIIGPFMWYVLMKEKDTTGKYGEKIISAALMTVFAPLTIIWIISFVVYKRFIRAKEVSKHIYNKKIKKK